MTDALSDDDTFLPPPKVIGAPDRIWLCYGELDRDDDHSALHQIQDVVTWCEDQQDASDVKYVRADTIQQQAAELETLRAHDQMLADANKELHDAGELQAREITELNTMMTYQAKSWGREQDINEETIAEKDAEIARLTLASNNAEGMAGGMELFRADMIRAGVVAEATPPMFMTEAVLLHISALHISALRAEETS